MKIKTGIFKTETSIFWIGLGLIFLGISMPLFINVKIMGIYSDLNKSVIQNEKLYLITAALKLVFLNSIRAFPHYLGVFFIAESVDTTLGNRVRIVKPLVAFTLIPLVYYLIELIYSIKYDFGIPAVLIIVMVIVLDKIGFDVINLYKKALLIFMIIAAIQCLDMIPSLSGWAFGRGEASNDIKMISGFLGADNFLQMTAVMFFLMLLSNSVLLFKLIMDERHLKKVSEEKEYNEKMLNETKMQVLENRTYKELQHLVHDLKTPLTSALALVGLLKMSNINNKDSKYLSKIESSIETMNRMISEILYEDRKSKIYLTDLIDTLLSAISNTKYASLVTINNNASDTKIYVNKIRFVRALINILENSYYAIDNDTGKIEMIVDKVNEGADTKIRFTIIDNGLGITPETLSMIWNYGFSSRNSLGLGLKFVKEVISNHGGDINVDGMEGIGTTVTINIPEGGYL